MSDLVKWSVVFIFISLLCLLCPADAQVRSAAGPVSSETLGQNDAIPITVTTASGEWICPSFSFSQIPRSPELFVGKLEASDGGRCLKSVTLALFRLDWNTHVMTLIHPLMQLPLNLGQAVIERAHDPYAAEFGSQIWVAFECGGQHITGTSACIAPLAGDHIDLAHLSIPIAGRDSVPNSPWIYSASTPKLLNFGGHLYLYWTAIQIEKAPPHRWNTIETRGSEMAIGSDGRMWPVGRSSPIPSHAPQVNVMVMAPVSGDPYRNVSVDTEGLYAVGNQIIVTSSVGGAGPDGSSPCVKPPDNSPGCFRLEITRSFNPLAEDAFNQQVLVSPRLPANPVEYPRIVTAPNGQTYLMGIVHTMRAPAAPTSGSTLVSNRTGYVLIPLAFQSLRFANTR